MRQERAVQVGPLSDTPILDLEQPFPTPREKRKRGKDLLWVTLAATGIIASGFLAFFALMQAPPSFLAPLSRMEKWTNVMTSQFEKLGVMAPLMWFSFWIIALGLHEAGHALAARRARFLLDEISAGPFKFIQHDGRWNFRWRVKADTDGIVRFHIGRMVRVRKRLAVVFAAGPITNLVTGLLAIVIAQFFANFPYAVRACLLVFGLVSIVIGVCCVIPYNHANHMSDGMAVLMLTFQKQRAIQYVTVLALAKLAKESTAPKHYKGTWIKRALSCEGHPYLWFLGNYYALNFKSSKNDYASAARHLEECLGWAAHLDPAVRNEIASAASTLQAWWRNDPQKARVWLDRIQTPPGIAALRRLKLDLVIACAERDSEMAQSAWEKGVRLINEAPDSAIREQVLASWQGLKTEVDSRCFSAGTIVRR